MRKILSFLLIAGLLSVVSACGGGDNESTDSILNPVLESSEIEPESPDSEPVQDLNTSEDDAEEPAPSREEDIGFTLEYKGFTIHMNQIMDEVLQGIGEPIRVFVQESCAFPGQDDFIYAFPGVQIMTYPDGDDQRVHTILIVDDSISIAGNIYLGSSFDDVLRVFGTDYEQSFSMYTYTRGQTTLAFLVDDNNNVEQIVFGLII